MLANMAQVESSTRLAEIGRLNEKEPPSRSIHTSVAKLPKLGVFSTSKSTIPTERVTPTQTHSTTAPQRSRLSSQTPSRQGHAKEDTSTVAAKQVDIGINLSYANSAVTAKSDGLDQVTRGQSKKKPIHAGLPIWDRKTDKEERPRTNTWPSLQYRLWLDASNLPLHCLCDDERATRPPYAYAPKRRKGPKWFAGSSYSFADRNNKDWSTRFLCVSKPPRPVSGRSGALKGGENEMAASLHVGVGESWQVTSSYTHRGSHDQNKTFGRINCISPSVHPSSQTGTFPYPRLPSRMGSNNLEAFLKQSNGLELSHSGEPIPGVPSSKLAMITSPRHFCDTSAEVNLLSLRSYARNPTLMEEILERQKPELPATHQNELRREAETFKQHVADGGRHVRIKVPCGSEEDHVKVEGLRRTTIRNVKRPRSDVTPPPTPPIMEKAYRIKNYITST